MRNNKQDDFIKLSDVIKDFRGQKQLRKGLLQTDVEMAWKEVMGPGIANYTTKIQYQNRKLVVYLSSAVLRQELAYGKSKIVANLNKHLGSDLINEVVLQ